MIILILVVSGLGFETLSLKCLFLDQRHPWSDFPEAGGTIWAVQGCRSLQFPGTRTAPMKSAAAMFCFSWKTFIKYFSSVGTGVYLHREAAMSKSKAVTARMEEVAEPLLLPEPGLGGFRDPHGKSMALLF